MNVLLSRDETYADISPVRLDSNGVTAFISIMRGCNNMCSFAWCLYPWPGKKPRRFFNSAGGAKSFERGFRDVTLLGQNVDSYYWVDDARNETVTFARLLERLQL